MATVQEAVRRLTVEARSVNVKETAKDAQALGTALDGVAVSGARAEKTTQSLDTRLGAIQRRYDENYRSQMDLARVERTLASAQQQGLITLQRRVELLGMAAERHNLATSAIRQQTDATERLTNVQRMQAAANSNTPGTLNTANIAAQFQDIGVTSAMGMSPIQIALQQGTQLSAVFEGLKASGHGVGTALASAFTSIISPVSLVTIGVVALTAVAIQYFSSVVSGGQKSEETLEKEAALIREVANTWGAALPALKAFADERQKLADQTKMREATDLGLEAAYADAAEQVRMLNAEVVDTVSRMQMLGASDTEIVTLQRAFADLDKAVQAQNGGVEEANRVSAALATLFNSVASPATAALAGRFDALAGSIATASANAIKLRSDLAIQDFNSRNPLGTIPAVFSGGGVFQNEADVQNDRANSTKSQYEIEQEALARQGQAAAEAAARQAEAAAAAQMQRLESLQASLLTEEETARNSYANQLIDIQEFYDANLIQDADYYELIERAKQEHEDRLLAIAQQRLETEQRIRLASFDAVASALSSVGSLLESQGEKQLATSKAFGIASALISTYTGIAKAMELPFPLNWAQSAAVAAHGFAQVAAISSTGKGGGGGAASGGAAGPNAAAGANAAPQQAVSINLTGDVYSRQSVEDLLAQINEAVSDGHKLVIRTV